MDILTEYLEEACQRSMEQALRDREYTQEFIEWEKQHAALNGRLEKKLKGDPLLFRLEELENQQLNMMNDTAYRQGLADCAAILKWLGVLP